MTRGHSEELQEVQRVRALTSEHHNDNPIVKEIEVGPGLIHTHAEPPARRMSLANSTVKRPVVDDGRMFGMITVHVVRATGLQSHDAGGLADPYVVASLSGRSVRTTTKRATLEPEWDEFISLQWREEDNPLYMRLEVWDSDLMSTDDLLGIVMLPLLCSTSYRSRRWYRLGRAKREVISGALFLEVFVNNPRGVSIDDRIAFASFCGSRGFNLALTKEAAAAEEAEEEDTKMAASIVAAPTVGETAAAGTRVAAEEEKDVSEQAKAARSIAHAGANDTVAASATAIEHEEGDALPPFAQRISLADVENGVEELRVEPEEEEEEEEEEEDGVPASPIRLLSLDEGLIVSPPTASAELARKQPTPSERANLAPPPPSAPGSSGMGVRTRAMLPDESETIEIVIPDVIVSLGGRTSIGTLYLTDFRLVLECEEMRDEMRVRRGADLSLCVPLGLVLEVSLTDGEKRHVAHRVETDSENAGGSNSNRHGREAPAGARLAALFRKLPGNFLRATSSNATSASPGVLHMTLETRDFRVISLLFTAPTDEGARTVHAMARALKERLTYVIANCTDDPVSLVYGRGGDLDDWFRYAPRAEMERQGVTHDASEDGLLSQWCETNINGDYSMCPSYPRELYVPRVVDTGSLRESAKYRSKGRLPVLCWYNKRKGNAIVRCAQPRAGLRSRRSEGDEVLIEACLKASNNAQQIIIFDARSQIAAGGNKLMGKGSETVSAYHNAKIVFMEIANIHAVRTSYDALRDLCAFSVESKWLSTLEATGWLKHIRSVLSAATVVARKMEYMAVTCVVHCSDGWDRTAQLTSLSQFMLDPYYRTLDGFIVLVEKEWLSFGHKFHDRQLAPAQPAERSPIFLQFLDAIWQICNQLGVAIEFNQQLLITLADHFQSGWFGTFLFNTERQRHKYRLDNTTTSLWSHVSACRSTFINEGYDAARYPGLITPVCSMKKLTLWTDYYLRYDTALRGGDGGEEEEEIGAAGEPGGEANVVVWVRDRSAKVCKDCGLAFTVFRRRHHCRACGHVFCGDCSQNRLRLPRFGYNTEERVCDACFQSYRPDRAIEVEPLRSTGGYDLLEVDNL